MATEAHDLGLAGSSRWRWIFGEPPRGAYVAMSALLLVGAVVIGGLIFLSASGQDRIALEKSTELTRAVLDARQRDLAKVNHDYAWWADAVQNLADKPDASWANDNIGSSLFDTFGITGAFVFDEAGRPVFGFLQGAAASVDPRSRLTGGLEKLIAAAKASPSQESPPVSGFLMMDGRPQLASAAMLSYTEFQARWQNGKVPHVLVFLRALDADYLKGIATDFGLTGLEWIDGAADSDLLVLPLSSFEGKPIGGLRWTPDAPGRALALRVLPPVAFAYALMIVLSLVVLSHMSSVQRSFAAKNRELRKNEAQLEDSRARLAEAARQAKLVYWRYVIGGSGEESHYTWAQAADLIFGRPLSEVPVSDKDFLRLVHPGDLDRVAALFRSVDIKAQSYEVEYRIKKPDGGYGWVHEIGEVEQSDGDKPISYAGTLQDISDLKSAATALEESERRFRSLADTVPVLVWLRNEKREFTFFNKTYLDFTGRTLEEECRWNYAGDIHPDDLEMWKAKNEADRGSGLHLPGALEYRLRGASGKHHWFLDLWRPQFDTEGRYQGDIGVLVDITERKQMEEELRQSQKLQSIGTLAGGIAHDLNNLLVPILGLTELTMEHLPKGERDHRNLENVIAAAERAQRLVEQILAFSRRDKPSRRQINLTKVVPEVLSLLRSVVPSSVAIREELDPGTPDVLGDSTQIHQVLMNLASNAASAMGIRGGILTIQVAPAKLDAAFCQLHPKLTPGRAARLCVTDTGKGMDRETLKRIFEPFFTTKGVGEGTGLGLSVVHGIVTAHGGAIDVESIVGRGTTFTICIPAA